MCSYSDFMVLDNDLTLGLAVIKCLTISFFSPKSLKKKKKIASLHVALNKCIICAFEISGRWSHESNYTTLLPGHSWLENTVVQEHLPAGRYRLEQLEPYSSAFYETKILMGSAYSPLVRQNQ